MPPPPPPDTPDSDPATSSVEVAEAPRQRATPPSELLRQKESSQRVLVTTTRLLYMVLLVTVALLPFVGQITDSQQSVEDGATYWFTILALFGFGAIVLGLDAATPNKRLASVVGVYLGVVAGLACAVALGALIDLIAESWDITGESTGLAYVRLIKLAVGITLCYLAVSIVLTTKDDFRLVIPYVEFAKQVRGVRPLLVDSSALIDGRIDSFASTGFLDAPLVLPQFVLDELQRLADSGDKLKRARGRLGLSVVTRLQENPRVDMSIDAAEQTGHHAVDHLLLQMASDQNLRILTTDYNLNKVAKIQGVDVLNINDLANTLKPQVIPGEPLTVDIVKRGESPTQGVGYMPDGTMVVVEDAAGLIGSSVDLVVTNSLQTSAGRMIFGKLDGAQDGDGPGTAVDAGHGRSRMAEAATEQPRETERPARRNDGKTRRNPRR